MSFLAVNHYPFAIWDLAREDPLRQLSEREFELRIILASECAILTAHTHGSAIPKSAAATLRTLVEQTTEQISSEHTGCVSDHLHELQAIAGQIADTLASLTRAFKTFPERSRAHLVDAQITRLRALSSADGEIPAPYWQDGYLYARARTHLTETRPGSWLAQATAPSR